MKIVDGGFELLTNRRCDMIDVTRQVSEIITSSGISSGDCIVHCPHTTGAITINENADPDVVHDILMTLEELLPQNRRGYRHMEGNSDSHVKSSLVGCSETIIIKDARMLLGTWQGIYFCEFDGPRNRKVFVQVRGE